MTSIRWGGDRAARATTGGFGAKAAAAVLLTCALGAVPSSGSGVDGTGDVEAGRRIYQEGVLSDGRPLAGWRWDEPVLSGAAAACAQCHRPSGMGSVEGDLQVPPVTGYALFGGDKVVATMDPRSGKSFNRRHREYGDASLERVLRDGVSSEDASMSPMMPRYRLSDRDFASLSAYLRQLSVEWSPGVGQDAIRFATVIAPDVDPRRRSVFKDMVAKAVLQKNGSTAPATHKGGRRHMAGAAEMVLGTERTWTVDVWELSGPADTWSGQLDELYRRNPVFALVTGLGGGEWKPIQEFSERMRVPLWFPSVDLPPTDRSRYALYFSRGVSLEADVLGAWLRRPGTPTPRRVVQVYRSDPAAIAAAAALDRALGGSAIAVESRRVESADDGALQRAVAGTDADTTLVLWLRAADLGRLDPAITGDATAYLSSRLATPDDAGFPGAWRDRARFVYPYELPDRRQANLAYFKAWLRNRKIALIDETMQSEVYFSLAFLTDCVTEMLDNVYRDYLVERAETMISRRESSKVEAEFWASTGSIRHRIAPASDGGASDGAAELPSALRQAGTEPGSRHGTTAYPRLGLGPGQRFASKGAYIARFSGGTLKPESDWIVP